jgi:thiol-disulfide isomerase/thioredoxin
MLRTIAAVFFFIGIASPRGDHGRVEWFDGTFEQALAEATKQKKIVFLEFWTKTCPFCKQLDRETLNATAIVEEARMFVCLPIDAESESGKPIAERYGIPAWPALVFLEPDGSMRDRFAGFRGPEQLLAEMRRVRAGLGTFGELERRVAAHPKDVCARLDLVFRLRQMHDERWSREMAAAREAIARGDCFDPKSPDERFEIAKRLRQCGDARGYEEQIEAIRELDPEGLSAPLHLLALGDRIALVRSRMRENQTLDPRSVVEYLADEHHERVLFEGWYLLRAIAREHYRKEAREFGAEAWKHCPPDQVASFGRELAADLVAAAGEIDDAQRAFALEVATKASEASPRSVDHLETLASCLVLVGRKTDAVAALERAQALEPTCASIRARLDELRR